MIGILVYVLVTKKTCDIEINNDDNKEIQIKIPIEEKETITKEKLEMAKQEIIESGNYDVDFDGEIVVYWNTNGTKYHIDKNCPHLHNDNSPEIMYGTLKAVFQKGITDPCRICIKPSHN